MRPIAMESASLENTPDWFRAHASQSNRALADLCRLMSNGIVLQENMKFNGKTIGMTDGVVTTVTHDLDRPPIVMVTGGRVLCYKILERRSNSIKIWVRLPSVRVTEERGKYSVIQCEDTGWFFPHDIVKIGSVITQLDSARDGALTVREPVVLTGVTRVSLYQESVDLLLF